MAMVVVIEDHTFTITKDHNTDTVSISSSPEGLDMLQNSVELAGHSDDQRPELDRTPNLLKMHEGTAAMWLQFEVLNFL